MSADLLDHAVFLQTTLGSVASVAVSPTGQLWAVHRGGRIWGNHSFDDSYKMLSKGAISQDVVVQLHPDTGGGEGHTVCHTRTRKLL